MDTETDFVLEVGQIPLWKQLHINQEKNQYKNPPRPFGLWTEMQMDPETRWQLILQHILWQREREELPPFFAMITGPTIQKYRSKPRILKLNFKVVNFYKPIIIRKIKSMHAKDQISSHNGVQASNELSKIVEALRVVIGRNTPSARDCDISLDQPTSIGTKHFAIEYDRAMNCYVAKLFDNHSIKILEDAESTKFVKYTGSAAAPIPLYSPIMIKVEGVPIFFQMFYILKNSNGHKVTYTAVEGNDRPRRLKFKLPSIPEAILQAKKPKKVRLSFAVMIENALNGLNGRAKYNEIVEYIAQHYATQVEHKKTWKNSVGGVLSSNDKFISEASEDDEKRGRGSIWRLRTEAEREQRRALTESDHVLLGDYSDGEGDQHYEMMDLEGDDYSSD